MHLVDSQIDHLCRTVAMVEPYRSDLVNPASLDVRLGPVIQVEQPGQSWMTERIIAGTTKEKPFLLEPKAFILAGTLESFALPDTLTAQFVLKSSRAREGLDHLNAGFCDPGWGLGGADKRSVLTMELVNVRQFSPVPLWFGMKIGQMVFSELSTQPEVSYSVCGRYNGDSKVQGSRG